MIALRRAWPPLAYLALSLLMTWPLARHLGDGLPGLGDALLQAWTIAWNVHAFGTAPQTVWDAPIFFPYPDTLAYTDNHLLLSALSAPLAWATGEPLLAHNLLLLLSFALSGWAVYLLVRGTLPAVGHWPPFVAGAAFAFCAYRFAHLTQLNLLQTAWMVFALLFLRRLLRSRDAGGGRPVDALLCGLFAGLQAITALYYAFFTAALLGGYTLLWAAFALWDRLRAGVPLPWRQAALVAMAGGLAAVLALPFTLPYTRVFASLAVVRSPRELDGWSAPLRAYVSVTQGNLLYARLGERVVDAGEMVLFPGLLVALLALAGLGMSINGAFRGFSHSQAGGIWPPPLARLDAAYWPLVAAAAFLLSLGTGLRLVRFGEPLPLPLPYELLYAYVPGFGALRVPARWGLLVTLALAILAAVALAALGARLRPRWRTVLGVTALAVVLAEQAAPPFGLPAGRDLIAAPPVYAWLAEPARAELGPVLELPVVAAARGEALERIMLRQWRGRLHWHPLVAGYSGVIPFGAGDLLRRAEDLPAEEHLSFLRLVGVGALVVHTDELEPAARAALLDGLDASPQAVRLAVVGAAVVYTLPPDPRLTALEAAVGPGGSLFVSGDERAPGVAALALTRRLSAAGRELYGPGRPRFYTPLGQPRPGQVFDAGLLGDAEDPRAYGFDPARLVWSAHGLALYQRDPALLTSLGLAQAVPGQFHPRYPDTLELTPRATGLRVGERELGWPATVAAVAVELDLVSLNDGDLEVDGRPLELPPGLSTVRLPLELGTTTQLAGHPADVAILRLRAVRPEVFTGAVTPLPGLVVAAATTFDGTQLTVEVRGAGADQLRLDIQGASAYDDRPVRLLEGVQALAPGRATVFAVDPLRPAAPWVSASAEPIDGRYIVYLRDAAAPASPGAPVAKFNLRGGALVDFEAVPLPLTAVP